MTGPIDPRLLLAIKARMAPGSGILSAGPMALAGPSHFTAPNAPLLAAPKRGRGLFDELFGSGIPEGLLSDEERKRAKRQAMLRAGLSLLSSAGPSIEPKNLGANLAGALQAGQEAFTGQATSALQGQDLLRQRQALQARDAIFQRFPPQPGETPDATLDRLQQMLPALIQARDPMVNSIVELLKSQGNRNGGFSLGPGETRFDAQGKPLAQGGAKREIKEVNVGNAIEGVDANTGEVVWRRPVARAPGSGSSDLHDQRMFVREQQLADDFRAQTKDYQGVGRQLGTLQASYAGARSSNPLSQMAMVFSFMKLLDPTSVVRESEYATAANAANVPDRVRKAWNNLVDGSVLAPRQIEQMYAEAQAQGRQKTNELKRIKSYYTQRAKRFGIEPEAVVQDFMYDDSESDRRVARIDALLSGATPGASTGRPPALSRPPR